MKVIFAYCHELGRSVSIDDARTEFFSRKPEERRRFTFSCSDRNCGITITGVNYHIKAEDGKKFRAAHFASRKPHLPKCEWVQFTENFEQDKLSNESEHDFTERKARQKLTDYINRFDPSIDDSGVESIVSCQPYLLAIGKNTYEKNKNGNNDGDSRWSRYTSTNRLQRLIDSWQEAHKKLSTDELYSLRIYVKGFGLVYLNKYITHIRKGLINQYEGVVYGGGYLVKRYGKGFLLKFIDKHEGKTVFLYVSTNMIVKGGFGHYVDEILKTDNVRYFRVFLLNPIFSERTNSAGVSVIDLEISNLRQLAIYYELNSSKDDESASVDKDGDNPA